MMSALALKGSAKKKRKRKSKMEMNEANPIILTIVEYR